VPTSFNIEKINDDGKDKSIHLSHTSADLIPGGYQKITVTYTPLIQEIITCANFKINCNAGNELNFCVKGEAEGFQVDLSSKTLHFGEVNVETETNRILNVVNNSDLPT
jgi:hypothetical protein